jgi:hypothetical protein
VWPSFLKLAAKTDLILNMRDSRFGGNIDLLAYAIGENPVGPCQIKSLELSKNPIKKEGAKQLAPALQVNKSLINLDLSHCNIGVSGMYAIAEALKVNTNLESINLYRNIIDVDGARRLGEVLKVNSTLKSIDIGHNRIRQTGLRAIMDGICANASTKLTSLGIRSNFINDDSFTQLFETLVFGKSQLTRLFIKQNFLSEFHKVALAKTWSEKNSKCFVDDFETVENLQKSKLDRTLWVSPMNAGMPHHEKTIADFFMSLHECGFVTDVRLRSGRTAPGRPVGNTYAIIEFSHENSVPRGLKLASKKVAVFGGQKARIYKAGTRTAILLPSQRRRK